LGEQENVRTVLPTEHKAGLALSHATIAMVFGADQPITAYGLAKCHGFCSHGC